MLADFIPLLPSGARRAGAAKVMAARVGHDPSILVDHPIKTQLLALGIGGAGNALTQDQSSGVRSAATLGPIALVQLLRRRELEKIQEKYDKEKRKRLAELDQEKLFDNGVLGWGGSSRLGAVNAYETMRARKYRGFGSLAEASDAIQLAAGAINPTLYTGAIPFVSGIDNRAADKMLKSADFSDQRNSPSLPLYLAAAALSSAGLGAASRWAHRENANTPALGTDNWERLVQEMSGTSPLLLGTEGVGNAFFYKPRNPHEASHFARATAGMPEYSSQSPRSLRSITSAHDDKVKRLERYGAIIADSTAGAPTIAHEAGHSKIEETPGVMRALQRHVYPHSRWLSPLAGAGSMAAGLASGSTLKGALLGTGIGAIAGGGMIAPEVGASYHALKHLKGLGDGSLSAEGRKDLISALSTYLAATVLPSTLSGAAGGWISGRRRKKEREKAAATTPKAVIIKGNPRYIEGNPQADEFYEGLADLLREAGYSPEFDAGEPYTIPDESAAFWVGHSRGQDRLRFAPRGVKTLAVDQFEDRAKERREENARLMEAAGAKSWAEWEDRPAPAPEHYQITDALREAIRSAAASAGQEKSAAVDLTKMWQVLERARKIKSQWGSNLADSHTMEHIGAVYSAAVKQFFNNPQVKELGLTSRTPRKTISEALKGLNIAPPAPPKPDGPLIQDTFDFFKKQGKQHPALPGLLQAKEHSDAKDYRQKSLLLRQMMDEAPDDWVIDSDDGKGIVGVTHTPTGFRLHVRKDRVAPAVTSRPAQ